MNALEVLREARDLLNRPYGWTKGHWHDVIKRGEEEIDCYCADGAIRHVIIGNDTRLSRVGPENWQVYNEAADAVARSFFPHGNRSSLVPINDTPGTRKSDIITAFDKAIEALQAREDHRKARVS